jgi:hypothetical protein
VGGWVEKLMNIPFLSSVAGSCWGWVGIINVFVVPRPTGIVGVRSRKGS